MDYTEAHLLSTEKAIAELGSRTSALDQEEIRRLFARYGVNQLAGKKQALSVAFDSRLNLEFHGSKLMSDGGLFARRELDKEKM
jgi:hypothetical protein